MKQGVYRHIRSHLSFTTLTLQSQYENKIGTYTYWENQNETQTPQRAFNNSR